jgi:TPR repeat protein
MRKTNKKTLGLTGTNRCLIQYDENYIFITPAYPVGQDFQEVKKLAESGNADAQNNLGIMYTLGEGTSVDGHKAHCWFIKSAEQGHRSAQYNACVGFDHGYNDEGDNEEYCLKTAAYWCEKSAEQGEPEAQNHLGWIYRQGIGVDEHDKISFKWYKKAADQGHYSAEFSVGEFYEYGSVVKQDYKEAAIWYHKAARKGDGDARVALIHLLDRHDVLF